MKINEFFDKGYYINLDRRTDRKEEFEKEMSKHGLLDFYERRPGVDSLTRPDIEYKQHFCSAAFYNVFTEAYNFGYEKVTVCEDDFEIVNQDNTLGLENIEKALDQLQNIPDWHIVYFGGYVGGNEVKLVSPNLVKADVVLTLHGFGLSRLGLEEMIKFRPFADSAFDGWIGQRPWINKYVVYPMSSIQRKSPSDLDMSGNTPPMSHFKQHYITGKIIKAYDEESNNTNI